MLTLTFGKTKKHPVDTSRAMYDTMDVNATLKDSVDVKAPIFKVNFDPSNYNYVVWAREDGPTRYYWIDNSVYVHNNLFEVHCSLDIMATYRDLIQLGLTGKLLYTTQDDYWDQYYDDLRFSPSSLDVYDSDPISPENPTWLHENSNVFGEKENLWDVIYDVDGKIDHYGPGTYIIQTSSDTGVHIYMMNRAAFDKFLAHMSSTFWTGVSNIGTDVFKYVKTADWIPIDVGKLGQQISNKVLNDSSNPWAVANTASLGDVDLLQGEISYEIPIRCILSFAGEIVVPHYPYQHPNWMENARWNKLILNTPSGNTELNLDMMYPRGQHNRVYFSTFYDVVSSTVNTKFCYDVKGGWGDMGSTPAFESEFQINQDVMALIQKTFNFADTLVKGTLLGAGVAAAAFGGGAALGAAGGGAGLAKMSAAKTLKNSPINLKQNGMSKADMASSLMRQGISESIGESAPLAKVAAVGAAVTKLNPGIDTSMASIQSNVSRAGLFNTQQLGLLTLRCKPLRCKELANDYGEVSEYPSPYAKYVRYCEQFGYPANQYINNLYSDGHLGDWYVFEDAHLNLSNIVSLELNGITDEEMSAIESIAKSGFYYN